MVDLPGSKQQLEQAIVCSQPAVHPSNLYGSGSWSGPAAYRWTLTIIDDTHVGYFPEFIVSCRATALVRAAIWKNGVWVLDVVGWDRAFRHGELSSPLVLAYGDVLWVDIVNYYVDYLDFDWALCGWRCIR